jgi:hypothetical protein
MFDVKILSARRDGFALVVWGATVIALVAGRVTPATPPLPELPSANEAIAIQTRVLDCELKAANRHDDGSSSISDVAESVMAACHREIVRACTAFNLSPSDPNFDSDNLKFAVDHIEMTRRIGQKQQSLQTEA